MSGPRRRSASPSPASATAPAASSRASSTTATPTRPTTCPGLMHVELGGYHVGDVEFVAAFDVDAAKVGLDLGKAIFAGQNNTIKFADVGRARRAGAARPDASTASASTTARPSRSRPAEPVDVAQVLRDTQADVLVSLPAGRLRGGAEATTRRPASTPASRSSTPSRCSSPATPSGRRSSPTPACPIVGDDIKSQVGATIVHRIARPPVRGPRHGDRPHVPAELRRQHGLQEHARARAARSRRRSRRRSRSPARSTTASTADDVHIGPSDHVPWLDDRKWAYIRLEGRNFGDVPLNIELKLEVLGLARTRPA